MPSRRRHHLDELAASREDTPDPLEGQTHCAICQREEVLMAHHLIPRSQQRKERMKRLYDRHEMRDGVIGLCHPCHEALHRAISEKELAESYASIELINNHPEVIKFAAWIRKKPIGYIP